MPVTYSFCRIKLQTPSDDDISVCYLYTDKISGTLSISNKTATCKSTVRGISGTTTKIVITQTLKKKMNLHGINTVVGQKHSTVGMRFIQIPKKVFKQRYIPS